MAQRWHEAIAPTDFVPYSSEQVRQRLIDLIEQVIDLLDDSLPKLKGQTAHDRGRDESPHDARAIGAALARLHYVQPEALGRTIEVLAIQLTEGLSPDQMSTCRPRIAALLGQLAIGFSQQAQQVVLTEQERIRHALTIELQHLAHELQQHHLYLEDLVEDRTADLVQANAQLEREIVHHRKTAEELRRLQEFSESVVQNMTEGIVLTDDDGYLTFVNPAAQKMLGYIGVDLIGTHSTTIVPTDFHPTLEDADRRRERGQSDRYEIELIRQDGTTLPVLVSGAPVFEEGSFTGTIAVFTDITALKQAEGSLQRRNRELALLNRAGEALISTLDLDETLVNILEETRHLLDVIACSIWLLDTESGDLVCQQATGPKGNLVQGWRLKPGEGIAGWVVERGESQLISDTRISSQYFAGVSRTTGLPLLSILTVPLRAKNRIIGVLQATDTEANRFQSTDITLMESLAAVAASAIENAQLHRQTRQQAAWLEQRVQERTAQLQAQYARVEAILNSSSDGIVVTDDAGEIIQTNPVAQAWLTQVLRPKDATRLRDAIRDLSRQAGDQPRQVLELVDCDLRLRAALISEPDWEGARVVVSISDVSEFKAVERIKTLLLDNLSDELSQPLSIISTEAYLARRVGSEDPDQLARHLDRLVQWADCSRRLLEDIRQLSRIYAGRLEMEGYPAAVDGVVKMVVDAYRGQAQGRGVTLEYRSVQPGPVAALDREQMTHALRLLLESGIQYTPEGGRVEVATGQKGEQWATITVYDTGEEIPQEDWPHVFQRLLRDVEPYSVRVRETGLQLMIVREIVALHDGEVTIGRRPDGGNAFSIRLPLLFGGQ